MNVSRQPQNKETLISDAWNASGQKFIESVAFATRCTESCNTLNTSTWEKGSRTRNCVGTARTAYEFDFDGGKKWKCMKGNFNVERKKTVSGSLSIRLGQCLRSWNSHNIKRRHWKEARSWRQRQHCIITMKCSFCVYSIIIAIALNFQRDTYCFMPAYVNVSKYLRF